MNTPVSFPLAKLIKEKGFDKPTPSFYFKNGEIGYGQLYNWNGSHNSTDISRPTISDVIMWIYEKHEIWISVDPENETNTWFHTITHGKSTTVFGDYSSLTEAYEAGIEDVLINMI